MIFAVLGDIHGNLPALETAIRHIDDEGIETLLVAGDLVVGGEDDATVCNTIRQRTPYVVQGLCDRHAALFTRKRNQLGKRLEPALFEAVARASDQLDSASIEYLAGLPRRMDVTLEGLPALLCHGLPTSSMDILSSETGENRLRREREFANARLILCGGAHQAFSQWVGDTLFVTPGSLGVATHGDSGSFALVNTEEEPWSVAFQDVPLTGVSTGTG